MIYYTILLKQFLKYQMVYYCYTFRISLLTLPLYNLKKGPTKPQKLRKSIVKFASNIKKALENLI